jgi:hypothetical protein
MAIQIQGNGGVIGEVDANRNVQVVEALPGHPSAGGFYSVAGGQATAVAAALAANTMLMSMRFDPAATRKAYVTKMRFLISQAAAVGAAAGVPGTIGIQRFTAQTPTGGTQRTVNKQNELLSSASNMFDVRDSATALTGTAPTFGNVVANTSIPMFITSGAMWMEWIVELGYPIMLQPGDGLAFRTITALAATQQWVYSYNVYWYEQ